MHESYFLLCKLSVTTTCTALMLWSRLDGVWSTENTLSDCISVGTAVTFLGRQTGSITIQGYSIKPTQKKSKINIHNKWLTSYTRSKQHNIPVDSSCLHRKKFDGMMGLIAKQAAVRLDDSYQFASVISYRNVDIERISQAISWR